MEPYYSRTLTSVLDPVAAAVQFAAARPDLVGAPTCDLCAKSVGLSSFRAFGNVCPI